MVIDYSGIPLSPRLLEINKSYKPYCLDESLNQIGIAYPMRKMRHQNKESFRWKDKPTTQFNTFLTSKPISMQGTSAPNSPRQLPSPRQIRPNTVVLSISLDRSLAPEMNYNRPNFMQRRQLKRKKHGLTIFTNSVIETPAFENNRVVTPSRIARMTNLSRSANPYEYGHINTGERIKIKHLLQSKPTTREALRSYQDTFASSKAVDLVPQKRELFKINRNYKNSIVSYDKHERQLSHKTQPTSKRHRIFQLNDIWMDDFLSHQV